MAQKAVNGANAHQQRICDIRRAAMDVGKMQKCRNQQRQEDKTGEKARPVDNYTLEPLAQIVSARFEDEKLVAEIGSRDVDWVGNDLRGNHLPIEIGGGYFIATQ